MNVALLCATRSSRRILSPAWILAVLLFPTAILAAPAVPVHSESGTVFRGLTHGALGNATLSVFGSDSLVVSGFGTSGLDGVAVYLPSVRGIAMTLTPVTVANDAEMYVSALSGADTLLVEDIASVDSDSTELAVAFAPDPGVTAYRVDLYRDSVLVRSRDLALDPGMIASLNGANGTEICIRCFFRKVVKWVKEHVTDPSAEIKPDEVSGDVGFEFGVVQGHIEGDDLNFQFNHIYVHPVGATVVAQALTQLNLTGSNLPTIAIQREDVQATTTPGMSPGILFVASMLLGLAGIGALRARTRLS